MEPNSPSPAPEEPPVNNNSQEESAPQQPVAETQSTAAESQSFSNERPNAAQTAPTEPVANPAPATPFAAAEGPALPVGQPEPLLPAGKNPGKTLGIIGFVASFIIGIIGLIISIVAFVKSKKAGFKNPLALAGIIIGALNMIGQGIFLLIILVAYNGLSAQAEASKLCTEQGNTGVVMYHAVSYDCTNLNASSATTTDTSMPTN